MLDAGRKAGGFAGLAISMHEMLDGDRGRIEMRIAPVIHDVAWLQEHHDWPGLQSIVMVESGRETGARIERETRVYITSSTLQADRPGPMIRDHRAGKNGLHWLMVVVFCGGECCVRKDPAPVNFTTIKHMASKPMRNAAAKGSMRLKRKGSASDGGFLASLVAE